MKSPPRIILSIGSNDHDCRRMYTLSAQQQACSIVSHRILPNIVMHPLVMRNEQQINEKMKRLNAYKTKKNDGMMTYRRLFKGDEPSLERVTDF